MFRKKIQHNFMKIACLLCVVLWCWFLSPISGAAQTDKRTRFGGHGSQINREEIKVPEGKIIRDLHSGTPCAATPTVTDIEGNSYNTVVIGTQCWMKENLKVTKYHDGSSIPLDSSGTSSGYEASTWGFPAGTGARTVYEHNHQYVTNYGMLYNWYAVTNPKGLCPSGWHIPTDAEWTTLVGSLGSNAGDKMKDTSSLWTNTTTGALNSSGFSALPGGCRLYGGSFINMSYSAYFWSASKHNNNYAWSRNLDYYNGGIHRNNVLKSFGLSVRCLRN
jgi:uncharacterized protein (TIGR02145 family)